MLGARKKNTYGDTCTLHTHCALETPVLATVENTDMKSGTVAGKLVNVQDVA